MIAVAALSPLLAVHIADGLLPWPWLAGGFLLASLLALRGAWRIRDEEIARIALLTAAFFVASLVHVPVPPTSVHLLLTGLLGVILGWRAALAIPIGLFFQAALFGHGGFTTLGVNSCVMTVPALLGWKLFAILRRLPWIEQPLWRASFVGTSILIWLLSLVYASMLLLKQSVDQSGSLNTLAANEITFHPLTLIIAMALAALAALAEQRLENGPHFPLGLLVGELTVVATAFLNAAVLYWGGEESLQWLALFVLVAHLPVAAIEGVIVGFMVNFLMQVKPEMLEETSEKGSSRPKRNEEPAQERSVAVDPNREGHE